MSLVTAYIDGITDELRTISLSIHDNPEQRFKERHAHALLTSYLQKQPGWTVTPSAYGLETAFVAVFNGRKARPVVSFNADYGMLPPTQ